ILSADRKPLSASLTQTIWLDPSSSLGELQQTPLLNDQPSTRMELQRLSRFYRGGLLNQALTRRFRELVAGADYSTMKAANVPAELVAPRILKDLATYSWDVQNPAIAGLRTIGKE